jgi:ABC-type phosphate transport system substrate-binding protein
MTPRHFPRSASALFAATLLAAALLAAATVRAQTPVYGGGGGLPAPYLNQTEGCYGLPTPLDLQSPAFPNGGVPPGPNGSQSPNPVKCPNTVNPATTFHYMSATSAFGIAAFFSGAPALYLGPDVNGDEYAGVEYAAAGFALTAGDLANYACAAGPCTEGSGLAAVTVAGQGVTPAAGQSANPLATNGPAIQIPLMMAPVVIAYNPVYKAAYIGGRTKFYSFNIAQRNTDKSGGLKLDMPTLCAIFNGAIVNWNDPALVALNAGQSLQDPADTGPFSVPIELVGRADGNTVTSILYRALAAQCAGTYTEPASAPGGSPTPLTYANQYAASGGVTPPAGLIGQTWSGSGPTLTPMPGLFTVVQGAAGVAAYLGMPLTVGPVNRSVTTGKLGYLSPDYALTPVNNTYLNGYKLNIADLVVGGVAIEPTRQAAEAVFASLPPPQSDSDGNYLATATAAGLRSAPQDWAEPIATTETLGTGVTQPTPLADPNANLSPATPLYPIVGTSNFLFYTCYANPAVAAAIRGYLTNFETNRNFTSLLLGAGFAPTSKAWAKAILATFVTPVTAAEANPVGRHKVDHPGWETDQLNLNILAGGTAAGETGFGGQCAGVQGAP